MSQILFGGAFSENGQYLACASTFGEVFIWDVRKALAATVKRSLESDIPTELLRPAHQMCTTTGRPLYCTLSLSQGDSQCLAVAGEDGVEVWRWNDALNSKTECQQQKKRRLNLSGSNRKPHSGSTPAPIAQLRIPRVDYPSGGQSSRVEVNCMASSSTTSDDVMYLGSGRPEVFGVDLTKMTLVSKLEGHDDYVLCVSAVDTLVCSASEDGTVNVWDVREAHSSPICTVVAATGSQLTTSQQRQAQQERHRQRRGDYASSCNFSADGSNLHIGSAYGKHILEFDLGMQRCIDCMVDGVRIPQVIRTLPRDLGSCMAVGSNTKCVTVWQKEIVPAQKSVWANKSVSLSTLSSVWDIVVVPAVAGEQFMAVCGASSEVEVITKECHALTLTTI